jgi:hypothetical protein
MRFQRGDAQEVSELIAKTLRTTNIKDYSEEYIENEVKAFTAESMIQKASWTHFYVICHDDVIAGCGAIGPYWGKMRAAFSIYLFCRNGKAEALGE